jgi:hypothetical protein
MTPSLPLSHHFGCSIIEIEEHLKQASHLVNPNSGIANDFLNQYNEILLLVENLPILLPEMIDDLLAWKPRSYEEYFRTSPLVGGEIAIKIYQALKASFRDIFEAQIEKINGLANRGIVVIAHQQHGSEEMRPEDVEAFCEEISTQLRAEIEKAADLVNHGLALPPETSQQMADRLMMRA